MGDELLLGESGGFLEVFDINTCSITNYERFILGDSICDIIGIDDTHYLLATNNGILKTTKNQMLKHYYIGDDVFTLCHISDSLYLVGFVENNLIVWNEQND